MPYLERKPQSQYIYIQYQKLVDNDGQPYEEWLKIGGTKHDIRLVDYTTFTEHDLQQRGWMQIADEVAQSVLQAYEEANTHVIDYANRHLLGNESSLITDLSAQPIGATLWKQLTTCVSSSIDIIQIEQHGTTEQGVAYVKGPSVSLGDGLTYAEHGVMYDTVELDVQEEDLEDDEPVICEEDFHLMSLSDYQHLTHYIRQAAMELWQMLSDIDIPSSRIGQPVAMRFSRFADWTLTPENRCYQIIKGESVYLDIYLGPSDPVTFDDESYIYDRWLRLGGRANYIHVDEFTDCPEFSHVQPNPKLNEDQLEEFYRTVVERDQAGVIRWCVQYETYVNQVYERMADMNATRTGIAATDVQVGTCLVVQPTDTAYVLCRVRSVQPKGNSIEIKGEQIQLDGYKRRIVQSGVLEYVPERMYCIDADVYHELFELISRQQSLLMQQLQY